MWSCEKVTWPWKSYGRGSSIVLVWMLCQKSASNFLRADSFSCFPLSTWNIFTLGLEASEQMDQLNRAQSTSTQIAVSVFMGSVKLHCLSSTSPIQSNNTHFPRSKKVSTKKRDHFYYFFFNEILIQWIWIRTIWSLTNGLLLIIYDLIKILYK